MDLLLFEMSSKIFLGVKSSESGFEEWREKSWSYGSGTRVILERGFGAISGKGHMILEREKCLISEKGLNEWTAVKSTMDLD